jgi:hypothetical protein
MQPFEKISHVRDTFAALIAADPFFTNEKMTLPVITEKKGDVPMLVKAAVSKLGMFVIVAAAETDSGRWVGSSCELRILLTAQISEIFLANQTAHAKAGLPYRSALEAATAALLAVGRKPNGLDAPGYHHIPRVNEFELLPDPLQLIDAPILTYHLSAFTTVRL